MSLAALVIKFLCLWDGDGDSDGGEDDDYRLSGKEVCHGMMEPVESSLEFLETVPLLALLTFLLRLGPFSPTNRD
jgi:hypothetical protein